MSEKKNIDRLFQEKFKDFEAVPQQKIWDNIAAELQKDKKQRRVIPIWVKLSGIAAILLIGLVAIYPFFNGGDFNVNPVVFDKKENNSDGSKKIKPTETPIGNNPTIINSGENPVTGVESNKDNQDGQVNDSNSSGNESAAAPFNSRNNDNAVVNSAQGAAGNNNRNNRLDGNTTTRNNNTIPNQTPATVAYNKTQNATDNDNDADSKSNSIENITNSDAAERAGVAAISNVTENNSSKSATDSNSDNDGTGGLSPIEKDVITEEAIAEITVDTTATAPENELEKLLQEQLSKKDEEAVADAELTNRWNIKPQLAPVFYNSLSQGSPIDAQFAGNSKEYDNNISYGVGVNYALSKKLSIRSGINTVNLSYATQGIEFYASLNDATPNVRAAAQTANIVVQNQGQANSSFGPVGFATDQMPAQVLSGQMVQQMGYVEVPVELSYALVDKKFGIDIIGGVSTLFLNNNNISVVSVQGYSTNIGEADNLNNVNFSTNVGLGFKYRFWKSFQANFEPTFKYQVNTFNTNSGNFRPYFIGLYSGVSFSF